jgi:hypothetical protein
MVFGCSASLRNEKTESDNRTNHARIPVNQSIIRHRHARSDTKTSQPRRFSAHRQQHNKAEDTNLTAVEGHEDVEEGDQMLNLERASRESTLLKSKTSETV